jgi:hypothetical protein
MIPPKFLSLFGGETAIEAIGLTEFCNGNDDALRVIKYENDNEECREATVRTAMSEATNPKRLFRQNCESFAVFCETGKSGSSASAPCAYIRDHLSCVDITESPPPMSKFFV